MIPSEQAKGKLTTAFLDYYYLLLLCIPGRSSHKYSYLPHLNLFPLPRHMCDYFWQRMENDQGDLTDIVRAGSRSIPSATELRITDWQLPPEAAAFPASAQLGPTNDFGDPFFNFRDPLINELAGVELFNGATEAVAGCNAGAGGCGGLASQKALIEEDIKRPCNIFSRVLQISPGIGKPLPVSPVAASEMLKINSSSSLVACPVDSGGRVQISSPPQTPGIKRRKSQAKKVVCIPAPAAASNRPSGEVVPSDLWAWRKYGQKPIKGSPYPRGYYRCSSSKGCSARKQVERSRTDPNMLVITYTSEHNHPWPTQRNALAGSTRSQPSKNGSKSANSNLRPSTGTKEGSKEMSGSNITALVKEEVVPEMENSAIDSSEDNELDLVFHQSYKSMIPDASRPEDFFSDFAELDPDPMSLIFSRGLMEAKPEEEKGENVMNPFSIFEWAGSSIGNAKKNL